MYCNPQIIFQYSPDQHHSWDSYPSTVVHIFHTNTALNSLENTKRIEGLSYLFVKL